MRISFFLVILLSMFASGSQAQQYQSVLWKISGNGLKKSSYLLGTVHVLPGSVLNGFPKLHRIMQSSDKALFEGADSVEVNPELLKKVYPPLDSVFSPEQYAIVDSFFIKHDYGSAREHNNNADLLAMLQLAIRLTEFENSRLSFEDSLAEFMEKYNKPVSRLDNPNLMAKNLLETLSPKKLADELVNYITGSTRPVLKAAMDMETYKTSLTANLHLDSSSLATRQHKLLVNERNLMWLPKIESQIKTGQCFIAVGLGHLEFKEGLINLLRKKGYKLTPVILTQEGK
jgi:uncharacterized protein